MAKNVAARKNSKFKVISTSPSVNKTPRGPSVVDVPYDVQQDLSKAEGTSPNVFFNGDPVYVKTSHSTKVTGDKDGSKGGVKSGTVEAQSDPIEASSSVFINGKAVVRVGDKQYMQGKNTIGKVNGTTSASAASITDDGQIVGLETPPPIRQPYAANKPTNRDAKSGELGSRTGSPVLVGSGNLLYIQTDITLHAHPKIALERVYRSDVRLGMFGPGWECAYHRRLIRVDESTLRLTYPDGRTFCFVYDEGSFIDRDAFGGVLSALGSGKFELYCYESATRELFDSSYLVTIVDPNRRTIQIIRDGNHRIEKIETAHSSLFFSYNALGLVDRIKDHLDQVWKYRYHSDVPDPKRPEQCLLSQVIDPMGGAKQFEYSNTLLKTIKDEEGCTLLEITYQGGKVHTYTQDAQTYTYRYEPNRSIKRSASGDTTFYAIDGFGHISAITYPDGTTTKEIFENNTSTIVDAGGNLHVREYDEIGRLVRYTPPGRDRKPINYTYEGLCPKPASVLEDGKPTLYTYDERFNRISCTYSDGKSETWEIDEQGNTLSHTDVAGSKTLYTYNPSGHPIRIVDALGGITQYLYDDALNLTTLIDPNEKIERYEHNKLNRLTKLITPDRQVLRFGYDRASRLLSVEESCGALTSYRYDTYGRLTTLIHPDLRQRTYRYEASQLGSVTLEDATICRFGYDRKGRLISQSIGNKELTFTYDSLGHLIGASDGYGTIDWVYDTRASVSLERQGSKSVHHAYDRHGLKRFIGYEGMHFNLFRSSTGELEKISQGSQTFEFGYNPLGELEKLCYPNRIEVLHTYDPLGRLIRQDLANDLRKSYGYDATHRLVMRDESAIVYDEAYRVLGVGTEHYTYDTEGNLLYEDARIDPLTKRLIARKDERFAYDTMGRLIQKSSNSSQSLYRYDDAGYLIEYNHQSSEHSLQLTFTYDPLGRRLTKRYKSEKEHYHHRYLYSGANIVAIYEESTDTLLATLLHQEDAIDSPLSIQVHPTAPLTPQEQSHYDTLDESQQLLYNQSRIKRYYFHRDYQNSVLALSDEEGNTVEKYTYDAFGTITSEHIANDQEGNPIQTYNPYRYTSREYDAPDLYYYRARYYDPTMGRFITPDPIGFLGGDINLYRYVGNDPVNFVDWSGFIKTSTAIGSKQTFNQPMLADVVKGKEALPQAPKPSNGKGSAANSGKDGAQVKDGNVKPIEPMKHLYFVCYTIGSNRGDEDRQLSVNKRIKEIVNLKSFNKKIHKVYKIKTDDITKIGDEIQKTIKKNGGYTKCKIKEVTIFAHIDHDHLTQWYKGQDAVYGYGFDQNFIKKTNKKLGKFVTLIKSDAKELVIGSVDTEFKNKLLKKANFGVGNVKLPNLEAKRNSEGYVIEAGGGFNTFVGKAQTDELVFKIPFTKSPVKISGAIEVYAGGLMATAHASSQKNNEHQKKSYGFGLTFGIGLGASITIDF